MNNPSNAFIFGPSRYSLWVDSKLRLYIDPLLIFEKFLWRGGFEYAISNHYDRHCVWEEVGGGGGKGRRCWLQQWQLLTSHP